MVFDEPDDSSESATPLAGDPDSSELARQLMNYFHWNADGTIDWAQSVVRGDVAFADGGCQRYIRANAPPASLKPQPAASAETVVAAKRPIDVTESPLPNRSRCAKRSKLHSLPAPSSSSHVAQHEINDPELQEPYQDASQSSFNSLFDGSYVAELAQVPPSTLEPDFGDRDSLQHPSQKNPPASQGEPALARHPSKVQGRPEKSQGTSGRSVDIDEETAARLLLALNQE